MKAVRLVFPQWQGGQIAHWIPEIQDAGEASRGYALGAELLNFLSPKASMPTFTVPVSTAPVERKVTDGVLDKEILIRQTRAALDILDIADPEKIVTLGGECSVSVAPFTWLLRKHAGDVAIVWIDAHPDITLPGDVYPGYHAMAVTACLGEGDPQILAELPAKFEPEKVLFVGLRDWERDEIVERQKRYGIRHLTPADLSENLDGLSEWLATCGASKVAIHFDLDVLDPAEILLAVGNSPNGLKMDQVAAVINSVAAQKELVGLTVAEPMPRKAILLRRLLGKLPLLGD